MGAAWLAAVIIVATTGGLVIRDLWRAYRQADREWRDEQYARNHRAGR